jgi:hypothetical protein
MTTIAIQKNMSRVKETVMADYAVIKILLILSGIFFISYVYLVSVVVFSVIERKVVENDIKALSSSIAQIEKTYLSAVESINLDVASAHGMSQPKKVTFVESLSNTSQFAFNNLDHEI